MTIISFLDDPAVVKRILVHLKLWEVSERSPPPASTPVISSTIRISSVGLSTDSCSPPSRRPLRSLRNRKNWAKPAFLHPIPARFTSPLRLTPVIYAVTARNALVSVQPPGFPSNSRWKYDPSRSILNRHA
jgi:hypothetical protein